MTTRSTMRRRDTLRVDSHPPGAWTGCWPHCPHRGPHLAIIEEVRRPARGVSEALPEALPRRDGRNLHAIAAGKTTATNVLD